MLDINWEEYKRHKQIKFSKDKKKDIDRDCVDDSAGTDLAVSVGGDVVPVCPPVFEGDFWVNEFLRLHRLAESRATGADGRDILVNQKKARDLVKNLMSRTFSTYFNQPVDIKACQCPDYFQIVTSPMDLATVRENLRRCQYASMFNLAEV